MMNTAFIRMFNCIVESRLGTETVKPCNDPACIGLQMPTGCVYTFFSRFLLAASLPSKDTP